jgi:Na+/phosphate symporter
VAKLSAEVEDLRNSIFYFIKNLDEGSVGASNFYINVLAFLTDMTQSLEYIGKISLKHVHNNHKKLKYNQIKELKELDFKLDEILSHTKNAFDKRNFQSIGKILEGKQEMVDMVSQKIEKQVKRTRSEESSPKNTTLYFSLLLETKDLLTSTMNLLELYYEAHDRSVKPVVMETTAK